MHSIQPVSGKIWVSVGGGREGQRQTDSRALICKR